MSTPAAGQLNRIVQLVAELSRRERNGEQPLSIAEVAASLGASAQDIERDLRTLTSAGDSADQDWLGSLSVFQEGNTVGVSSLGPFRRPIRLTPEELLAIQVGLSMENDGGTLSHELAALLELPDGGADAVSAAQATGPDEGRVVDLARRAARERRCLEILYSGARAGEPIRRTIEVHQVMGDGGHWYLVAWCRNANAPRRFRAERVLEARLLDEPFVPRPELSESEAGHEVFAASEDAQREVVVRFTPAIARWLFEDHPSAERDAQGGVTVRYAVAEPAWLLRTVLQYGAEAEVVAPPEYRALMRTATALVPRT